MIYRYAYPNFRFNSQKTKNTRRFTPVDISQSCLPFETFLLSSFIALKLFYFTSENL
jgi:hypothetical protein